MPDSLTSESSLQHLLSINNLPVAWIVRLLDQAEDYINQAQHIRPELTLLKGEVVANLFFESSTRTRCSFELAARRLGADVINFEVSRSSVSKGESLIDTIETLAAMSINFFIIRHPQDKVVELVANHLRSHTHIINAGDGQHEHPTQALLDMLTIRRHKKDFSSLRVAFIGDITHSRVARSDILALNLLGVSEIRLIGPAEFMPKNRLTGCTVFENLETGLKDIDVVIVLRIQDERLAHSEVPDKAEFFQRYGLTPARLSLAKKDAIVMHPGPMNRGVEIAAEVADGPQSVILEQVSNGIAIRMAVLATLAKSTMGTKKALTT